MRSAATIVVSKLGAIGAERAVETLAAELNPGAELVASAWSELPDEWWSSLLARGLGGASGIAAGGSGQDLEADELDTMALEYASLPTPGHLIWVLDALSAGVFGRLDRAKGSLPCGSHWLRFDLVERAWAVTDASDAEGPAASSSVATSIAAACARCSSRHSGVTGPRSTTSMCHSRMPPSPLRAPTEDLFTRTA